MIFDDEAKSHGSLSFFFATHVEIIIHLLVVRFSLELFNEFENAMLNQPAGYVKKVTSFSIPSYPVEDQKRIIIDHPVRERERDFDIRLGREYLHRVVRRRTRRSRPRRSCEYA